MYPKIEGMSTLLHCNNKYDFSNRSNMLALEYVNGAVKRMLDGTKGDMEDFVFGFKGCKNKLVIEFAYGGEVMS